MNQTLFNGFLPLSARAFFTENSMDFSLPFDAAGLSAPQKDYLRHSLSIDPSKVATMRQVHGARVLVIGAKDIPQSAGIPEADAMVTNVPGVVLSVRTADCLPVFLFDPNTRCIGLVHAGWKGSALGIVRETVKVMKQSFEADPADLLVGFGPAIRPCCYEVGPEMKATFPGAIVSKESSLCLDLPLVNRSLLLGSGVKSENIKDSGQCTVCGEGLFSYRRDGERSGRHLSLLFMV